MEPQFQSFDSFEEMFSTLKANQDAANEALHDEQRSITFGSYAVRTWGEYVIFGEIYDRDSFLEASKQYPRGEIEQEWRQIVDSDENGMAYGTWYSVLEPGGELGSAHKVTLWPISKELFEVAKSCEWSPDDMPAGDEWLALTSALSQLYAHLRDRGYAR